MPGLAPVVRPGRPADQATDIPALLLPLAQASASLARPDASRPVRSMVPPAFPLRRGEQFLDVRLAQLQRAAMLGV